jgi:hypothetical protein
MRHLPFVAAAALSAIAASQACVPSVAFDSESEGCADPEPPSTGWCPPAWSCIDGTWVDTAGACPDPCPASQPSEGDPCDALGHTCTYEESWFECDEEELFTVKITCTSQGWTTMANHCSPRPDCPDELPIHGGDCTGWYEAYDCSYPVETQCGAKNAYVFCNGSSWDVSLDASCPSCTELDSAAACSADPACRWLVPGCGEPPLAIEGCYPAEACTDTCPDEGDECTTVLHDPCWLSPCDACGAETNVCQPAR